MEHSMELLWNILWNFYGTLAIFGSNKSVHAHFLWNFFWNFFGMLATFIAKSPTFENKLGQKKLKKFHKCSIKSMKKGPKMMFFGCFMAMELFMELFLKGFWSKPGFFLILSKKNKKVKNSIQIKKYKE